MVFHDQFDRCDPFIFDFPQDVFGGYLPDVGYRARLFLNNKGIDDLIVYGNEINQIITEFSSWPDNPFQLGERREFVILRHWHHDVIAIRHEIFATLSLIKLIDAVDAIGRDDTSCAATATLEAIDSVWFASEVYDRDVRTIEGIMDALEGRTQHITKTDSKREFAKKGASARHEPAKKTRAFAEQLAKRFMREHPKCSLRQVARRIERMVIAKGERVGFRSTSQDFWMTIYHWIRSN